MLFREEAGGEHTALRARFGSPAAARAAAADLGALEFADAVTWGYCTLPGEAAGMVERLRAAADEVVDRSGWIEFLAHAVSGEVTRLRRAPTRLVRSAWGDRPRHCHVRGQCGRCGEFRGTVLVLPVGAMWLDKRELRCRCDGIPCRYCAEGVVRRPLAEHLDPELRSGHTPWFGFLVPCGGCQAAGRGPRVLLSA